jgi:hypothetical protein
MKISFISFKEEFVEIRHDLVVISLEKTSSVLTQACERGTLRQVCVQAVICMDRESEVALQ